METVAGVITGRETVEFVAFPALTPPPACVVVDIALCGICGTDIASFRGGHLHSPAVCGHEWVGHVSHVGPAVAATLEGERVVISVPPACGRCPECDRGLGDFCRTVSLIARGRDPLAPVHGGFAPRITVAANRVVAAHPALSDEEAAQVEPAAVALHGVRRSGVGLGDLVVVQGAGPIGLLAAQFARAAGAGEVVVVEPNDRRRALALSLGASSAVAPDDAAGFVAERSEGLGADVVLECTGVSRLLQNALDLARAGGTVGLISFLAQPPTVDAARWLARQLTVVASTAFTHDDVRVAMGLIADGRISVGPMHTRTVPLADLGPTLASLAAGDSRDVKVLVDPT